MVAAHRGSSVSGPGACPRGSMMHSAAEALPQTLRPRFLGLGRTPREASPSQRGRRGSLSGPLNTARLWRHLQGPEGTNSDILEHSETMVRRTAGQPSSTCPHPVPLSLWGGGVSMTSRRGPASSEGRKVELGFRKPTTHEKRVRIPISTAFRPTRTRGFSPCGDVHSLGDPVAAAVRFRPFGLARELPAPPAPPGLPRGVGGAALALFLVLGGEASPRRRLRLK